MLTTRTCAKRKLHGKYSILRGHKRNCPYQHCSCSKCASHENMKDLKEQCSQSTATSTVTREDNVSQQSAIIPFPTVIQLANLETETTSIRRSRTAAEKREEERQKKLERHREFYSSINILSADIIRTEPNISPLQVLKTSIQLHQQHIQINSSKDPILMMPTGIPRMEGKSADLKFSENMLKLKEIFPNTNADTLAALLREENNSMEAVISIVLHKTEEEEEERVYWPYRNR
ncbi:hypothetical protein QZH41_018329 [Actinostola sp. cb2023]|nr:hypothetical protein QZH41_018329 [Actinostola sp. cb2023]